MSIHERVAAAQKRAEARKKRKPRGWQDYDSDLLRVLDLLLPRPKYENVSFVNSKGIEVETVKPVLGLDNEPVMENLNPKPIRMRMSFREAQKKRLEFYRFFGVLRKAVIDPEEKENEGYLLPYYELTKKLTISIEPAQARGEDVVTLVFTKPKSLLSMIMKDEEGQQ